MRRSSMLTDIASSQRSALLAPFVLTKYPQRLVDW